MRRSYHTGAVDASSYVTIQPAAAEFDTGAAGDATGLSVVLPNDRGLPVGTAVDIWSFDHDQTQIRSTVSGMDGRARSMRSRSSAFARSMSTSFS